MDGGFTKLYYYTTTGTMQSILTSGTFWATNILYMNDSEEYANGLQEIKGIFTRYRTLGLRDTGTVDKLIHVRDPHIYTISFCTNGDLLSQWCIYARESGVNLELDFDLLRAGTAKPHTFFCARNSKTPDEIAVDAPLRPVIYFTRDAMMEKMTARQVKLRAKEIIDRIEELGIRDGEDGAEEKISELAAQIKRYEFSAEREWRLFFNMTEYAGDHTDSPFFYREQDNILKPFIKVSAFEKEKGSGVRTGPWPVTAIMVGPGYNQDQVFKSLRYFLNFGNYIRRDDDVFRKRALDLYVDKVGARCLPAVGNQAGLKRVIASYQKKAKPSPLNSNIMCELASAFKAGLSRRFPECAEVLDSIELTSGGIILQKSNIPYIY